MTSTSFVSMAQTPITDREITDNENAEHYTLCKSPADWRGFYIFAITLRSFLMEPLRYVLREFANSFYALIFISRCARIGKLLTFGTRLSA